MITKNGPVAERLGRALQKLLHQFESGQDLMIKKNIVNEINPFED